MTTRKPGAAPGLFHRQMDEAETRLERHMVRRYSVTTQPYVSLMPEDLAPRTPVLEL